ncbi:MAG TPA: hypothetical protein VMX14_12775 [Anaerolineae bacterium]|nr:hypothetical protein [Anaerolineae bacterium]
MSESRPSRPVSAAQIAGILSSTLALFFVVAFAGKSLDAYRLSKWRDRLQVEVAEMVRQREELEEEVRRRQSAAWAEEALRDAGQVSDDLVRVIVATFTPSPLESPTRRASPTATPAAAGQDALFRSDNWRAWQRLIWGFD